MNMHQDSENPGATAIASGVSGNTSANRTSNLLNDRSATAQRFSYFLRDPIPLEEFERETEAMMAGLGRGANVIPLRWHGDADPYADRAWLVRGILPEKGKGLLAGQWGTAKTFSALDLSGAVMTGMPFAGHKVERRGGVLFIAAEGGFEIPIRLRGLVEGKLRQCAPATPRIDLDRLPFVYVEECPRLVGEDAMAKLQATAEAVATRLRSEFGLPLVLIVIDTLAAAAGFEDENSASETQKVFNLLQALSHQTGAFVLGIDHFGKAVETGTRGSSAKEAAADAVLAMLGEKDVSGNVANVRMAVRKIRGARSGFEVPLSLEVQQLGETDDGEPITSCFIAWQTELPGEPKARAPNGERWTVSLRPLRDAIGNVLAAKGVRLRPFGSEGPEVLAATVPDIRAEFVAAYPATGDTEEKRAEAKRKAFKRRVGDAVDRKLVVSREVDGVDHLWLPGSA